MENSYSGDNEYLLTQIKQHAETDLQLLVLNYELREKNDRLEQLNVEP